MSATILIIEDCTPIGRIIAQHLASRGYCTLVATSADDACRVLEKTTPDCLVLDLMMPGMTGAELLHRLRTEPRTADVPVVLVSARVGHGAHVRSAMDADYSVGKPFTRRQLLEAVRTVLARRAAACAARAASATDRREPRFIEPA